MDGRHHAEDVRPRQRQRKAYEKKSLTCLTLCGWKGRWRMGSIDRGPLAKIDPPASLRSVASPWQPCLILKPVR